MGTSYGAILDLKDSGETPDKCRETISKGNPGRLSRIFYGGSLRGISGNKRNPSICSLKNIPKGTQKTSLRLDLYPNLYPGPFCHKKRGYK